MKVLRMGLYVHVDHIPEFKKNKSGYGRSVWDISRNSANINEEYLFTFNNSKEKIVKNVNILENKYSKVLKSLNIETLIFLLKTVKHTLNLKESNLRNKLSIILKSTYLSYFKKLIEDLNPDIIHIHGVTCSTFPFIVAALNSNKPLVVTLHGLNMNLTQDIDQRDFEQETISYLNKRGISITVVGSGMKQTILDNCIIKTPELITTVNDGVDASSFTFSYNKEDIKSKFRLSKKDKVVLYVGSLTENKNQIILLETLRIMSKEELKNIKVFFIGMGPQFNFLKQKIKDYSLTNNAFLVGQVDINELSKYYTIANVTVLLSKEEGFGRPIIESYVFGVPVIAFSDLAAVNDLYEKNSLFKVEERSANSVYKMLKLVLDRDFDKEQIIKLGRTKSWGESVEKYNTLYQNIVNSVGEREWLSE